jgi:heme-degrading monooxygenase HmoA
MAIKLLIKRRFKEGKAMEIFTLLNKLRSQAMDQPGYITGETLIGHDDPLNLLVIGTWQSMENWLKWKENPLRIANEAQLQQYLEKPTEYEAFVFGTPPHKRSQESTS